MDINEYFDKIYCINLDKRKDRWERTKQIFHSAGIYNYTRFPAVNNTDLNFNYSQYYKAKIATLLSKLNLLKDAYYKHYASVLIFEDDIEFDKEFHKYFSQFILQLPLDWDLLYLGGNDRLPANSISQNIKQLPLTYSNHALAVNSKAYQPLIDILNIKYQQIISTKKEFKSVASDLYIASTSKFLNHYGFDPYLVWQRKDFSDIENKNVYYYKELKSQDRQYKQKLPLKKRITRQIKWWNQDSLLNKLNFIFKNIPVKYKHNRIKLVIFSKDRAMQLDALLESIRHFNIHLYDDITVLYKATNIQYKKGYEILKNKFTGITYIAEKNFNKDLKSLIKNDLSFTTFLVDDNLFFFQLPLLKNQILKLFSDKKLGCFSLRLGLNCTYSHPADKHFELKNYELLENSILKWDWTKAPGSFNYPLSLDGHIFRTKTIQKIINRLSFNSPSSLESRMQKHSNRLNDHIASFQNSILIGNPVNIVNTEIKNRAGIQYAYSEEDLNKLYLDGKCIDINNLNFGIINACHKEIELKFKYDNKRMGS